MTDRAAAPASERPLPPLPEPCYEHGECVLRQAFSEAQMRTYVLADRAAQAGSEWLCGYAEGHRAARHEAASAAQALRVPLTNEQIEETLGAAYRKLVIDAGYNGGMGGETWDRAAARAIEAAHGIVPLAPQDTGERG